MAEIAVRPLEALAWLGLIPAAVALIALLGIAAGGLE